MLCMSNTPSGEKIIYEYPLNERIRTLLRLNFLFERAAFGQRGDSEWHSRMAVDALLDIMDLLSRSDVRAELQKELERQHATLTQLLGLPNVADEQLKAILEESERTTSTLRKTPPGLPLSVRGNEFLGTIQQRAGILGGTCAFDLPSYHLWLQSAPSERRDLLTRWFSGFDPIAQGCAFVLRLLRMSADPVEEIAPQGSFNAKLDPTTDLQMLRVQVARTAQCFPEISGSRHFCTIRFLSQPSKGERPKQTEHNVPFILERCVIQNR